MLRLIVVLLVVLVPAGLGTIYVWSSLNLLLHGDASMGRVLLATLALVGVFVLLYGAYRYIDNLEEPQ